MRWLFWFMRYSSVFSPCCCIAVEQVAIQIAVPSIQYTIRTELPCAHHAVGFWRFPCLRLIECRMFDIWVCCNPSHAVRLHTTLVESPRVRVNPRPHSSGLLDLADEGVHPFYTLFSFPVQNRDAVTEVIGTVLIEPVRFLSWGTSLGKVVEPPRLSSFDKLLNIFVTICINEISSLCSLDNNTTHLREKGREVGETRPPLMVGYVDEGEHRLTLRTG